MEVSCEEEVIISISSGVVCPYSEYFISFGGHSWKIGIGSGGEIEKKRVKKKRFDGFYLQ